MIKRALIAAGMLCGLAIFLVVLPLSQESATAANDVNGKNAIGSYMFKFTGVAAVFGPGSFVPGLATLSSDGTLSSITGSDQAGPSTLFSVKNSAVHGVWFKTGPRSVGANGLYLNFDPIGGQVVSITKLRIVADFDKNFNNATGQFFNSIYVCPTFATCPDPLSSSPTIPEPAVGLPFTIKRIS